MELLKSALDYLHQINAVSILVRILLAALAGGLVGIEREFHGRAAGLRTHMLVSLGAALTAIIGAFLGTQGGFNSDVTRIAAQVMSGVGFLGAGTILLKKGNSQITGLTTAAGLWATAAIGLAVGFGLYFGAFVAVAVMIFAFTLMSGMEHRLNRKRQKMFFYLELDAVDAVQDVIDTLGESFLASEVQVTPARSGAAGYVGIEALIRIPQGSTVADKIRKLHALPHVVIVLPIN